LVLVDGVVSCVVCSGIVLGIVVSIISGVSVLSVCCFSVGAIVVSSLPSSPPVVDASSIVFVVSALVVSVGGVVVGVSGKGGQQ